MTTTDAAAFLQARDLLLAHRADYAAAYDGFRWPALAAFNWALDYFDPMARGDTRPALELLRQDGSTEARTFAQLAARSSRVANCLRELGVQRGDRVLLMLPNAVALWETLLGAMKLGAVVVPATPQLTVEDLRDRFDRGGVRHVVVDPAAAPKFAALEVPGTRVVVGPAPAGWTSLSDADRASADFLPDGPTQATDPLLLYFTSGTTAKPKLVLHTHASYPVGHLTTMYWLGLQPGDRHLNISSPGWAKHAYSSVFAPWNAGATVLVYDVPKFDARALLATLVRADVSTLCAPPTVWRMLINEDLGPPPPRLREVASAGEPLNPEVIERVQQAWRLTIRDGYGQTETTLQVGNPPGQPVRPGSMGRPMPGYRIELLSVQTDSGDATLQGSYATEGEIAIGLQPRPTGLMVGYLDDPGRMAAAEAEGWYRTGDVAVRDAEGYITYVGRADDVFKSSDYRISPFELESVLIEHPAVAEAGVVESPDPLRLSVPKAFVTLRAGYTPSRELAGDIFRYVRERLAPYKRVRRLEFAELPKTISGKIRRVELRVRERAAWTSGARSPLAFHEEDFPELTASPAAS